MYVWTLSHYLGISGMYMYIYTERETEKERGPQKISHSFSHTHPQSDVGEQSDHTAAAQYTHREGEREREGCAG